MRIGQGFDVHAFSEGRKLVLGGVEIPYKLGLLGHSDADVLIHAVMDALLGAAGLLDIGYYFPDTDVSYKNISSLVLLKEVRKLISGYEIINLDATLIAQNPKIAPFINFMKINVAEALEINVSQISIKATTTEKLGFTGREEGIAAQAVCLLEERSVKC